MFPFFLFFSSSLPITPRKEICWWFWVFSHLFHYFGNVPSHWQIYYLSLSPLNSFPAVLDTLTKVKPFAFPKCNHYSGRVMCHSIPVIFYICSRFLSVHSTQCLNVQVWFLPSAALFYNLFVFLPKSQHCLAKRVWKLGSCNSFHSAWLLSIAWFKFSQEISIIKFMPSKSQHLFFLGPQDVRLSSQPSPSLVLL